MHERANQCYCDHHHFGDSQTFRSFFVCLLVYARVYKIYIDECSRYAFACSHAHIISKERESERDSIQLKYLSFIFSIM